MLHVLLMIVAVGFSIGIAWATLIQGYRYLWRPLQAVISRYEFNSWSVTRRCRYYAEMAGAFIGVCYCFYKGIEGALWWIPRTWTTTNEDGDTEWIVHGLALTAAIYGAVLLMIKLEDIANERASNMRASLG